MSPFSLSFDNPHGLSTPGDWVCQTRLTKIPCVLLPLAAVSGFPHAFTAHLSGVYLTCLTFPQLPVFPLILHLFLTEKILSYWPLIEPKYYGWNFVETTKKKNVLLNWFSINLISSWHIPQYQRLNKNKHVGFHLKITK